MSHDIQVASAGVRQDLDVVEVAAAVRASVGMLMRRMRQVPAAGDLSVPESSALSKLDRGGPTTAGALARQEQISPQSMGTTLAGLEARGLVERRPDPADGRRVVLSATEAGRQALVDKRSARTELLARALSSGFTSAELGQLMAAAPLLERLAERL